MCRLLLLTATDISRRDIADIVDRTLLLSAGEGNHHGWGILTANKLFKDAGSYLYRKDAWINVASQQERIIPVMAHVRSASRGTRISNAEVQPFLLSENNMPQLSGIHNGTIYRSWADNQVSLDSPSSDTFRIFHRLYRMLGNRWVDKAIIEEWMSAYEKQSSFAIMLRRGKKIAVFRNDKRMLYYSYIGNGVFITTSLGVAHHIVEWANRELYLPMTEPRELAANTLWHIPIGSRVIEYEELSFDRMKDKRFRRIVSSVSVNSPHKRSY